jgi:putative drug exporter of the RND superfamily
VNRWLERLGRFSARWHWAVIISWAIILVGLVVANQQVGGQYVNNYNVPGTSSDNGLKRLNATFSSQGGYAGQIVFHARTGTVTADAAAVNQATANVAKLPDVTKAVSPLSPASAGAVSTDGAIAYSSVSWNVNPSSLDTAYLNRLNGAVAPAREAGLQVEYGAAAGEIGQKSSDKTSELIGLVCALILLLLMFGSLVAAAIPLVSAIFSVGAGLSLLGVLAAAITFPTTAPTIATLLGLGVAIDLACSLSRGTGSSWTRAWMWSPRRGMQRALRAQPWSSQAARS